jgi:Domain of unknown function (DUF4388)
MFTLPDVLRFLATTRKTGCLHLEGDRGRGTAWFDEGEVLTATVNRSVVGTTPLFEVLFEMLRFTRGSFSFATDEPQPQLDECPEALETALEQATQLLEEWRHLEEVVPSLNHRVALAPELTAGQVVVDAERWRALAAVAAGRPVAELAQRLGLGELEVTRTVSDLVDLGVVVVEDPGSAHVRSHVGRRDTGSHGVIRAAANPPARPSELPPRETMTRAPLSGQVPISDNGLPDRG